MDHEMEYDVLVDPELLGAGCPPHPPSLVPSEGRILLR